MVMSNAFVAVAEAALQQSSRNDICELPDASMFPTGLPAELARCYQHLAPRRLFLSVDQGLTMRIFGLEELALEQDAYECEPHYVFASVEGDPITLFEGRVWTAEHGAGQWQFEEINSSLEAFWADLLKRIDS